MEFWLAIRETAYIKEHLHLSHCIFQNEQIGSALSEEKHVLASHAEKNVYSSKGQINNFLIYFKKCNFYYLIKFYGLQIVLYLKTHAFHVMT